MRAGTVGAVTAALLVASGVAGCAGSSSSGAAAGSGANGGGEKAPTHVATPPGSAGSATGALALDGVAQDANVSTTLKPLPKQRSTVIMTGRLALRVSSKRFADAVSRAEDIAGQEHGYVVSSDTAGTKQRSSTIVIRVPAARFGKTMDRLKGVAGGTVLSEQRTGEDVGQQFVDLGARVRNLRAQSQALIRLMNKAVSVSDTIRVQNELFQVQGQIDQLEGRLRYLHDQADRSTITLELSQSGGAAGHHHHSPPSALGSAFRRGWHHAVGVVTAVIVGAGIVIPVALLAALGLLAGLRLWPPVRRRMDGSTPPAAQDSA